MLKFIEELARSQIVTEAYPEKKLALLEFPDRLTWPKHQIGNSARLVRPLSLPMN